MRSPDLLFAGTAPILLALSLGVLGPQSRGTPIEFTPEEQVAIKAALDQFAGYSVAPENADRLKQVTIGRALFYYAVDRLKAANAADGRRDTAARTAEIAKGVNAIRKAYRVHALPLYLCDEARFMEAGQDAPNAIRLYKACISGQAVFKADQFDRAVLTGRDVPAEVREARERLKALGGRYRHVLLGPAAGYQGVAPEGGRRSHEAAAGERRSLAGLVMIGASCD